MEFWRSYDGTVALGWLCAVAFVAAIREASLSDEAFMVQLAYGVMVAAVVIRAYALPRVEDETAGREHGPHV